MKNNKGLPIRVLLNKLSLGIKNEVINHITHDKDDDIASFFFWTYYPPLFLAKHIQYTIAHIHLFFQFYQRVLLTL